MVVPSGNNNQTFAGGQMTDLPPYTGGYDPTALIEIVAPGNVEDGINYSITLGALSALLTPIAANVEFTPTGPISATNVQDAIDEVATDYAQIASLASVAFSGAAVDLASGLTAWTPVFSFATPGDFVAGAYTAQIGRYAKLSSNLVLVQFNITTAGYTFTTASGNLQISGLPFTVQTVAAMSLRGAVTFTGINKAGYTQCSLGMASNATVLTVNASGMGVTSGPVVAADVPSGGTLALSGEIIIFI